jgi:ferredoxin
VVDWREDCANCHNCVKKACVYDRYRLETQYLHDLNNVDTVYFQCMGCFSCVQECTKGVLALSRNPAYERLGNRYWTPEIIDTTWSQAETAKDPVSGAGYRGRFSGTGFDAMWTDMSEIVRPTRDGKNGREYISTSVDIGRKPRLVYFDEKGEITDTLFPLVSIPMPLIIDMMPSTYRIPKLFPIFPAMATRTGLLVIMRYSDWEASGDDKGKHLSHVVFYLDEGSPAPPSDVLKKTRLVEISDEGDIESRIKSLKKIKPDIVVVLRVELNEHGEERAIKLGEKPYIEALHLVSDINGNQTGTARPEFIKDMVRRVHTALVKNGTRDEITIIAGGGIALAEHLAKQMLCGADLVSIDLPLLIALECRLCEKCDIGKNCPTKIEEIDFEYGVGRMTNLISAWHDQLIEVMGAMGIREARRLRGEAGRALFFEDLEGETFGKIFGTRKKA